MLVLVKKVPFRVILPRYRPHKFQVYVGHCDGIVYESFWLLATKMAGRSDAGAFRTEVHKETHQSLPRHMKDCFSRPPAPSIGSSLFLSKNRQRALGKDHKKNSEQCLFARNRLRITQALESTRRTYPNPNKVTHRIVRPPPFTLHFTSSWRRPPVLLGVLPLPPPPPHRLLLPPLLAPLPASP